jgi:nicotinamidase-related amidase
MIGTPGQKRIFEEKNEKYIPSKEVDKDELEELVSCAANKHTKLYFEKQHYDVSTNTNFEYSVNSLLDKGLDTVVIDGFATDYCVKAAALAFIDIATNYGKKIGDDFNIYVVTDAIAPVTKEGGRKALDEMYAAGIKPITAQEILEGKL